MIDNGEPAIALYGSFLPVPDASKFGNSQPSIPPGHIFTPETPLLLNRGKSTITLSVVNTADRPIQIGSHYHFVEANPYLEFDRNLAYGR